MTDKKATDWASIELHYRAGKRSLDDIGKEFGVSKGRISQVAKKDGWERNLQPKIDARAAAKVANQVAEQAAKQDALNDPTKQAVRRLGEAAVVEANANIVASAELVQREDVLGGLEMARGMMGEIMVLSRPDLREVLEWIGEQMDQSYTNEQGNVVRDKVNEMYRAIIDLAGRVKMAKDLAAVHNVYIPLQRKVLKMEDEANKGVSEMDRLLAGVLAST